MARGEDESGGGSSAAGRAGVAGSMDSGGTGGVSVGGMTSIGGGPTEPSCMDSDSLISGITTLKTRGVAIGTNGTFEDGCDENGNLVEAFCEMVCESSAPPETGGASPGSYARIRCPLRPSGTVRTDTVECGGLCRDGACFHWCPESGDTLNFDSASELEVSFRYASDFVFRCTPTMDACASPSLVGQTLTVSGLNSCSPETVNMTIAIGEPGSFVYCVYDCLWE
jgi:hypothetical protein